MWPTSVLVHLLPAFRSFSGCTPRCHSPLINRPYYYLSLSTPMAFVVPKHLPRAAYGHGGGHGSSTSYAEPVLQKLAEATRESLTADQASKWVEELQKNIDETKVHRISDYATACSMCGSFARFAFIGVSTKICPLSNIILLLRDKYRVLSRKLLREQTV